MRIAGVLRPVVIAALTACFVLLSGCQNHRPHSAPVTHLPAIEEMPPKPQVKLEAVKPAVHPAEVTTNKVTPPVQAAPAWVQLESFTATLPGGRLERPHTATNLVYRLHSGENTLTFTAGSRQAVWNGIQFWLGTAPVFTNGSTWLSQLDAVKTVNPLLVPAASIAAKQRVIVIDPGHGGTSSGTRSILGNHFEKEYTLDWARRLRPLLEAHGLRVVLTRDADVDVSLTERIERADREQADLFVSLHFNSAFPKQEPEGLETYCLTPTGLNSTLVRLETDDPTEVLPNNRFDDENLRLAALVHRSLLSQAHTPDRGVRRARFMTVLRGQQRPAILIEGGYLSNPSEARRIASPEHRQKLAEGVAKALQQLLESGT